VVKQLFASGQIWHPIATYVPAIGWLRSRMNCSSTRLSASGICGDIGRVARRGLENVRAELLEKVLAYNFCRLATSRPAASRKPMKSRWPGPPDALPVRQGDSSTPLRSTPAGWTTSR